MNFNKAQENMRFAYYGGGPGLFASGTAWVVAGLFGEFVSVQASVLALFLGGMFIHPIGIALSKLLKRPGKHEKGNPLAVLALESTFILFIGLFIAFSVVQVRAEFFYPIMLMVIGGRYLLFSTMYGMRIYWAIGGVLAVSGMLCLVLKTPFAFGAFVGGAIEIVSSVLVLNLVKTTKSSVQAV